MSRARIHRLLAVAVIAAAVAFPARVGSAPVRLVQHNHPAFDEVIDAPTTSAKAWMRSRYHRMVGFSPYFDARLAWYGRAWAYQDLYAIYPGSTVAREHPDWILRDRAGRRLFVDYGCAHGSCPQWAADITRPAYRAWWIAQARGLLTRGYGGIWVDDVNVDRAVVDGYGRAVTPVTRRGELSEPAWAREVAAFAAQIRAALPAAEIVHNSVWSARRANGQPAGSDPDVLAQASAANWVNVERGCTDPGLTGGTGEWSLRALLDYVDRVHQVGVPVIWQPYARTARQREYNLACLLLTRRGRDLLADQDARPSRWWAGFDTDPGTPGGGRYDWQALIRRDFTRAIVLLNPPGEPPRTVELDGRYVRVDGTAVPAALTVRGGRAFVLLRN